MHPYGVGFISGMKWEVIQGCKDGSTHARIVQQKITRI
jgi:hypothetical protein